MSTLDSNHFLGYYQTLSESYDLHSKLIPTNDPRLGIQVQNAYDQFSNILKLFLSQERTIDQSISPKAYNLLLSRKLQKDGFLILKSIIFKLSPQLGGDLQDLQEQVSALNLIDNELLVHFYNCLLYTSDAADE